MTALLRSLRRLARQASIARLGALALLAFNVALVQAQSTSAAICSTSNGSTGQGAVFSVMAGGQINAGQSDANGSCNVQFYGSAVVNAPTGGFIEPGTATTGSPCKNYSQSPAQMVVATGTTSPAKTLPTFQYNAQTYNLSYSNSSQVQVGSNWYNLNSSAQTISSGGRTVILPAQGGALAVPSGTYTDWGTITAQNGTAVTFQANAAGVNINTLNLSGCNGVVGATFAPGNYFIQNFNVQAGCSVGVSGNGAVNLYVLNGFTFNGGPGCYNYTNCGNVSVSNMAAQLPQNLKFWVYNGNVATQGALQIAASIYVANGSFQMSQGGNFALVGEVLAQNITFQNNSNSYFYYANTSSFTTTSSTSTYRLGSYALAPAAVPPLAQTGSLVYFAEQNDANASGTPAISGHLYAVPLGSDGSASAAATWDAASLMTVAQRQTALMTQSASGSLVSVANVDSAAFGAANASNASSIASAIINPNYQSGAWLNGRDPASLLGRPWQTAPIIAGNLVVIGDDDGMLYGFNKTTGALVWGFFPRENLPAAANPGTLMNSHPWGQIAYYVSSSGTGYVVATGMQGAMHLALQLGANGSLAAVAWKDYESGAVSPASPFGGAAPTMALDQTGSAAGNVAYIVANNLVRRALVDGTNAQTTALSTTATSNLLYVNDTAVYYGDTTGSIQGVLGASSPGSLGESPAQPVLWLTGAYLAGSTPSSAQPVLLGASTDYLTQFAPQSGGSWGSSWHLSSASSSGVPNLPTGGAITALPTITQNLVYVPVTVGTAACTQTAEEIGPLSLATGATALNGVSFRDANIASGVNVLGPGVALFAAPSQLNGYNYVFADGNGGGTTNPGNGWGQYASQFSSSSGSDNMRLNWRELTSFFVSLLWPLGDDRLPAPETPNRLLTL
jgi:hypothetical protein